MVFQSSQSLTLRRAIAEDAEWAVPQLFAAGPALFSYIFAASPTEAQHVLYQAFGMPQHAFSYEHTHIVEVDGAAAGLVISYPGSVKKQADEKVHFVMARITPLRRLPKILVNVADFSRIKQDVALEDYYVLGLSVAPEFRNRGIGSHLLAWAEAQAQAQNCLRICADVTYVNVLMKQLLERRGYQIECSKTTDRFEQMTRSGGIHRLVKLLM
ncbi:MAG: GNAT family N-acetyltransferase [Leptolyngbyaceae cyanobacterium bins.302]|nr:GNAT family N-acetyltransferase [Leptolyngbyaceae cyanobacterium bins.302]